MGLTDRGAIREGMRADLVVFDPHRIIDRALYDDPFNYPEGIEAVFCNGTPTLLRGRHTNNRPGYDFGEGLGVMDKYRVAAVQDSPIVFDREATLEKVRELAGKAAQSGAKLVLFPEAFVSAYPKGLDFGARIGSRTPEGREDFRRYFESAVEVPGPAVDTLAATAKDFSIYLVIGVIERGRRNPVLHRSLLLAPGRISGQAPQAHAHRLGAVGLGLRRRLDHARFRYRAGQARGGHLLGKLYAHACG